MFNHILARQYVVSAVGYDTYNATAFMKRWEMDWGPNGIVKVIQGPKTESVPLGELKIKAASKTLLIDEKIMTYTMGNAMTWEDTKGNRKLAKRRNDEKIDNVSALMDAYVALKANPDLF
jgi:phage terminase large subunit-like protein